MMSRLSIARWIVDVDPVATADAYATLDLGSAERCGCADCHLFLAARESCFPRSVTQFLQNAGIPRDIDIEISTFGEVRDGIQLYSGFYHLVGTLVDGGDAIIPHPDGNGGSYNLASVTDAFSIGVTTRLSLLADAFPRDSTLQLEFTVELPLHIEDLP